MSNDPNLSASIRILDLDLARPAQQILSGKKSPIVNKVTTPQKGSLCANIFNELARRATVNREELHADYTHTIFTNGEHKIVYDKTVAGRDVFVVLTFPALDETKISKRQFRLATAFLTNNYVFLAKQAADAARRAGAAKIHLLIPNLTYARQDQSHKERGPITAAMVVRELEQYYDKIVSLHLHSAAIEGMAEAGKVINISPNEIWGPDIVLRDPETFEPISPDQLTLKKVNQLFSRLCFGSPDSGGLKNTRDLAKYCKTFAATLLGVSEDKIRDIRIAVIDKRRPGANQSEVMNVLGKENVRKRRLLLIDDMTDTAGTLVHSADAYMKVGALTVEGRITHSYCLGDALQITKKSKLSRFVTTNSMALRPSVLRHPKISALDIAPAMVQVIADLVTKPEPNVHFHARNLGAPEMRTKLGRYVTAMMPRMPANG